MEIFVDAIRWLADSANYSGPDSIPTRVVEHVLLSFQATVVAALIALPVGLYIGHRRRFEFVAVTVGNLGRALPSFGILAFFFPITFSWPGELGYWATFIALVALGIPPILTNAYVGIKGVDEDAVEAARGVGMSEREVLSRLEVPLATPLIIAGLRTASVQAVATATLWAVVAGGGLGRYIIDGLAQRNQVEILGGAILVAALALLTEALFGAAERLLAPSLSSEQRRRVWSKTMPAAPPGV